jgi:membrane associated rhomboid family serine protease
MNKDLKNIYKSLVFPLVFTALMWVVKIFEVETKINLAFLGIYPLQIKGLPGIFASPFIHGDWAHLYANTIPFLILSSCIFYFYREIAFRVFFMIWGITGLWVWFWGQEAFHIGSSGLVYGFAAFIFLSGLLRREKRLMSISFFVAFTYGSLVWGIFPELFPDKNISWESHLMGLIAGSTVAWYFRREGPQKIEHVWDDDEEVPDWYPQDPPPDNAPAETISETNFEINQESKPEPENKKSPDQFSSNPGINYIYRKEK